MTIRKISKEDLEDWVEMRSALWPGDNHRPEILQYFEGTCREPTAVMVAVTGTGELMGHIEISVRFGPDGEWHGFIEGLFVKPQFRRGNVFRELVCGALAWSAHKNFASVLADRGPRLYEIQHSGAARLLERHITEEELHQNYPLRRQSHEQSRRSQRGS